MEERKLDARESMELISRMIQNTRNRLENHAGRPFLVWGYTTVGIALLNYWFNIAGCHPAWCFTWFLIPIIGCLLMRLFPDKKPTEPRTEIDRIVGKVCYLYAVDSDGFDDLYQEVLINLWRGFDGFEGRAKVSSWVYRVALNTCISYYRRNRRHTGRLPLTDSVGAADEDPERGERLRDLYALINRLDALEKAVVMLWLDELPYEEIAAITGLTRNNVASKLHRIKLKLREQANH